MSRRHCSHLHQHSKVRFLTDLFLIIFCVQILSLELTVVSCDYGFFNLQWKLVLLFRILALEKLGAVFNQVSHPLQHTPRKFVIHPETNNLIVIETDYNAYTEATKMERKQQMAEVGFHTLNGNSVYQLYFAKGKKFWKRYHLFSYQFFTSFFFNRYYNVGFLAKNICYNLIHQC